jgi:hypothetical protein
MSTMRSAILIDQLASTTVAQCLSIYIHAARIHDFQDNADITGLALHFTSNGHQGNEHMREERGLNWSDVLKHFVKRQSNYY